jgi:hypothetical protein
MLILLDQSGDALAQPNRRPPPAPSPTPVLHDFGFGVDRIRVRSESGRSHPTPLDWFANTVGIFCIFMWPTNIMTETTGKLCASLASRALFCTGPAIFLFALGLAMAQNRGQYALSPRRCSPEEYPARKRSRLLAVYALMLISIACLGGVLVYLCPPGCKDGLKTRHRCETNATSSLA